MSITTESYWQREVVPPNLQALGVALCRHFRVPADHFGAKGSTGHRRGYHRSRAWLLNSVYATNRTYSVDETPGNRRGDPNWVSGFDLTLPAAQLIPLCQRLDAAVRAGRLNQVAEWYGNRDGDSRVDGYDNIRDTVASSDPTHLWHVHVSLIREHADDDHTDLLAVLIGEEGPDMATDWAEPWPDQTGKKVIRRDQYAARLYSWAKTTNARTTAIAIDVAAIRGAMAALVATHSVADPASVIAAVRDGAHAAVTDAVGDELAELLRAIADDIADGPDAGGAAPAAG